MLDFVKVTEEQRQMFDDQGYLIVRGVLNGETIAQLIEAGDKLIYSDSMQRRQRKADGVFDSFRNCIELSDAFIPLLTHPMILPIVIQLMGPNLHMTTSHLIYRAPDPPDAPPRRLLHWHRDIANSVQDLGHDSVPRMQVKCAYYLTDLSQPSSGATLLSPGSNHLKQALTIPPGCLDPDNVLEPLLMPGDCVLFENRTWHAGGANQSRFVRKVVMFGYGYRWLKAADYLRPSVQLREKLDPLGRFLMGEPYHPTEQFRPGGGYNPLREWCKQHNIPQGAEDLVEE